MRLIGLAVILTISLFAATLAAEAQSAEKVYRIGWLSPASAITGASNFDALRRTPCEGPRNSRACSTPSPGPVRTRS